MCVLDYGNEKDHIAAIQSTWEELRNDLRAKKFSYNDIDEANQSKFLTSFSDAFVKHGLIKYVSTSIEKLNKQEAFLVRGARLTDASPVTTDRFLPVSKFITSDNRFSPKGLEWLYLSYAGDLNNGVECCKAECRVKDTDYFGYCTFSFAKDAMAKKIIDLTISDSYSYDEINKGFDDKLAEFQQKVVNRALINHRFIPNKKPKDYYKIASEWFAYLYTYILSNGLFQKIETDDKELEYAPFQCMASYFQSLGFDGILYKSTVYNGAKDLAIFDKTYAIPNDDVTIEKPKVI